MSREQQPMTAEIFAATIKRRIHNINQYEEGHEKRTEIMARIGYLIYNHPEYLKDFVANIDVDETIKSLTKIRQDIQAVEHSLHYDYLSAIMQPETDG